MPHVSVLLKEAIEGLHISPGDIVLDATLGSAGHTEAILSLEKDIRVIGIDLDRDALERSRKRVGNDPRVEFVEDNFRNLDSILPRLGIPHVTKALFDFGLSSEELNTEGVEKGRGFSFLRDEPLVMTFMRDPGPDVLTAYDVVNTWDLDILRTVIRGYGEERFAGRIAKA